MFEILAKWEGASFVEDDVRFRGQTGIRSEPESVAQVW